LSALLRSSGSGGNKIAAMPSVGASADRTAVTRKGSGPNHAGDSRFRAPARRAGARTRPPAPEQRLYPLAERGSASIALSAIAIAPSRARAAPTKRRAWANARHRAVTFGPPCAAGYRRAASWARAAALGPLPATGGRSTTASGDPDETRACARRPGRDLAVPHRGAHGNAAVFHRV
jgi:hypothetical protein